MIKFNKDIELVLKKRVDGFDEESIIVDELFSFKANQTVSAKIMETYNHKGDEYCDIHFDEGGAAFGVLKENIQEI